MSQQGLDPHAKIGMHFQDLFRPLWTYQGNVTEPSFEDMLRSVVMTFVNAVAFALDARGLSPLRVPEHPFPDFSYVVAVSRDSVLIVMGTSPFRMSRTAIYRDLRSASTAPTANELRAEYEQEHGWSDCLAATLPAEVLTAPSDAMWPTIEKAAKTMADEVAAQVKQSDVDDALCFVIMSFSGNPRLEDIYHKAIQHTVKYLGYRCERVDQQQYNTQVTARIQQNIRRARFIVADMTEARPNCYYELAVAHTLGKEVIHLTSDIKDVHFDVKDFNFIVYKGIDDLRAQLRARIKGTVGVRKQVAASSRKTAKQEQEASPSAPHEPEQPQELASLERSSGITFVKRESFFGDLRKREF